MSQGQGRLSASAAGSSAAPRRGRGLTPLRRAVLGLTSGYIPAIAGLILALVAWEAAMAIFDIPTFLIVAPSAIAREAQASPDLLATHALVTFNESWMGFVIGSAAGIAVAILIVHSAMLSRILMPWLIASQVMPKIAIAPLILLWFGYGLESKVAIAAVMAVFPVVISHALGMRSTPSDMLDLARSMRASRWQIFAKLMFPYSLPALFSGLKIAATLAVIGAVVGEFVGGSEGLGFLITTSQYNFNVPRMFASLILLMVIGVGLYAAVVLVESFVLRNRAYQTEVSAAG